MADRKRPYDDEGEQKFSKRDRRNDKVIKVLCPYYSAGAVIGKGGEAIKHIKEETGANIQVSKNNVRFPNTDERVISISGELEAMQKVISFVQEKIRTDKIPPHVKNINTSQNDARKATCKIVVPDTSVGKIIGKGGSNVNRLKDQYKVKIGTMKKEEAIDGLRERIVTVESEDHQNVADCIAEMVKDVFEDEKGHMDYFVNYDQLGSAPRSGPRQDDRGSYGSGGGGYGDRSQGSYRSDRGSYPGDMPVYGGSRGAGGYGDKGGYSRGDDRGGYGAAPYTAPSSYPPSSYPPGPPSYGSRDYDKSSYGGYGGSSGYASSAPPYGGSSESYSSRDHYSSSRDSYSRDSGRDSRDSYNRASYNRPSDSYSRGSESYSRDSRSYNY